MSLMNPFPKLMTPEQWLTGRSLALHVRSTALLALDTELQLHEQNPTVLRLSPVVTGLKATKGHKAESGGAGKAWKATLGFLNA